MNRTDRVALLSTWIKPSSDDEKNQQERALRMVQEAISAHDSFSDTTYKIYAKGSYRNRTNVRRDSDVDIVVEMQECFYYDYVESVPVPRSTPTSYDGGWTRESWRAEIVKALVNKFPGEVDSSGNVAINVEEKPGSRPSIDIVPSYQYRWYYDEKLVRYETGSAVWTKEMKRVVNWPHQQYNNGVAKNTATGGRYKYFARALKNAENTLVAAGTMSNEMPSYLMECLVYNADNGALQTGDLEQGFKATLQDLYNRLNAEPDTRMLEPNDIKYLFHSTQKWTTAMGKQLIEEAWRYLGYGEDDE